MNFSTNSILWNAFVWNNKGWATPFFQYCARSRHSMRTSKSVTSTTNISIITNYWKFLCKPYNFHGIWVNFNWALISMQLASFSTYQRLCIDPVVDIFTFIWCCLQNFRLYFLEHYCETHKNFKKMWTQSSLERNTWFFFR